MREKGTPGCTIIPQHLTDRPTDRHSARTKRRMHKVRRIRPTQKVVNAAMKGTQVFLWLRIVGSRLVVRPKQRKTEKLPVAVFPFRVTEPSADHSHACYDCHSTHLYLWVLYNFYWCFFFFFNVPKGSRKNFLTLMSQCLLHVDDDTTDWRVRKNSDWL